MKPMSALVALGCAIAVNSTFASDPVRIGVTSILSGPNADRGQSEQYGVELALQRINVAGRNTGQQARGS